VNSEDFRGWYITLLIAHLNIMEIMLIIIFFVKYAKCERLIYMIAKTLAPGPLRHEAVM
jgi:hypothetical protein